MSAVVPIKKKKKQEAWVTSGFTLCSYIIFLYKVIKLGSFLFESSLENNSMR